MPKVPTSFFQYSKSRQRRFKKLYLSIPETEYVEENDALAVPSDQSGYESELKIEIPYVIFKNKS